MTLKQIITVASAFVLAAVIFLFGELQPPPKKDSTKDKPTSVTNTDADGVDLKTFANKRKAALGNRIRETITDYEKQLEKTSEVDEKVTVFEALDSICRANNLAGLAAYYSHRASQVKPTQNRLFQTGKRFKRLVSITEDTIRKQKFQDKAIQSLRAAIERDSTNFAPRIALANLYLQDRKQVMKGITILLEIVENQPEHARANLILGRYGIISGQYKKAISRLKKVADSDTLQARAHFHLGEAHFASGNKKKALSHFNKSKESMNNPALRDTIDKYIDNIKNI